MSLYRIKPLEWKRDRSYMHAYYRSVVIPGVLTYSVYLDMPVGEWGWVSDGLAGVRPCDSLEAGKAACEAHWRARLAEVLESVSDSESALIDALEDFVRSEGILVIHTGHADTGRHSGLAFGGDNVGRRSLREALAQITRSEVKP